MRSLSLSHTQLLVCALKGLHIWMLCVAVCCYFLVRIARHSPCASIYSCSQVCTAAHTRVYPYSRTPRVLASAHALTISPSRARATSSCTHSCACRRRTALRCMHSRLAEHSTAPLPFHRTMSVVDVSCRRGTRLLTLCLTAFRRSFHSTRLLLCTYTPRRSLHPHRRFYL